MVDIILSDEQEKIKLDDDIIEDIKKVIELCLEEEDINFDNEISITFTDNENIRQINKQHRNIDSITDVLSFPMYDIEELELEKNSKNNLLKTLGDIVISLEKAKEQSISYAHSLKREICYLVCHSMFHLLGYDHMDKDEKKVMREKEDKIMQKLGILR